MRDYANIDISALTVNDALGDSDWGQKPNDVTDYFAFDRSMLRMCRRLSDAEVTRVMRCVCDYVETGELPDYDGETSSVAIMLDSIIASHDRRIGKAYLNAYKAYVKGKVPKKPKTK